MPTLTATEFKKGRYSLSDYQKEMLKEYQRHAEKIAPFWPVMILYEMSEEPKGKKVLEHFDLRLVQDEIDLRIAWIDHIKKYCIRCQSLTNQAMQFTHHVDRYKIEQEVGAPNNFAAPSVKKITDWVVYYLEVHAKVSILNARRKVEMSTFRKALLPYEKEITWWNRKHDNWKGHLDVNGIRLEFESTYLFDHMQIKIDTSVPDTLQSFEQLSQNKYKPKK